MKLLFIMDWIGDETMQALGWTLFHSLWIGLLAAVISGIIIIATRRSTARLRYNLLTGVMFLFLISCVLAFFVQTQTAKLPAVEFGDPGTATINPSVSAAEYILTTPGSFTQRFTRFFNDNVHLFVLAWMILFMVHCIKLLNGLAGIQRLKNHKTNLPDDEWIAKLDELSNKLGIRRSVTLLQSALIKVPVAVGFLKPAILVPIGLLSNLPPGQVEAILLHELAHIRRKDYLINLLQRFAEAIFFFNPSFVWLCSLIRQEREACCDDLVVATTGQKRNYLEALVSFQEYAAASSGYAMAIKSKENYLLNRVKRLLTRENKKLNVMEKLLLLFGLIVFTAFTIIPQTEKNKHSKVNDIFIVDQPLESKAGGNLFAQEPVKKIRDTVPVKEKRNEIDLKQISTNVNIDGNTKTETITAFDPAGKKYIIIRQNDKLTSLQVDDRIIPENEIVNYASVINEIDQVREKNRQRKMKETEARKADNEKKKVENENKMKEKNKNLEEKIKNKEATNSKSEELIRKKIETKRKEVDADRKVLDQKRKEMTDVRKEITIKKQELKTKDGKEKENILKDIKTKEKLYDNKLKDVENRKKIIGDKKQEIGDEKEKLEKIKEKENKSKEKEEGKGDGNGEGKGEGEGKREGKQPDSKKIFLKENSIESKQEARHSVSTNNVFNTNSEYKPTVKFTNEEAYEPALKAAPTAPGWKPEASKPFIKKPANKVSPERIKNSEQKYPGNNKNNKE